MPWLEDLKFPRGYQMGTHIELRQVALILKGNDYSGYKSLFDRWRFV